MAKMTTSEARAEAATIVLKLLLEGMGKRERKRLRHAAKAEGKAIGNAAICEEIDWLFEPT